MRLVDAQDRLAAALARVGAEARPGAADVLRTCWDTLAPVAGLVEAVVHRHGDTAAAPLVLRPGDGAGQTAPGRVRTTVVPLRLHGHHVGDLHLRGTRLSALRRSTLSAVALHLALALHARDAEDERRSRDRTFTAMERLFEQGAVAEDVASAGRVLAEVTAEVFGTQRAGVHLVKREGRIRYVLGVGTTPAVDEALTRSLLGRLAQDSPVWRATQQAAGPVLVGDSLCSPSRAGGFVQTLQLRSYVAVPLLSATGLVGMAVCGDVDRTREWSEQDLLLARLLAGRGSLVVENARLREEERHAMREMAHRAFHDGLTELPNRSLLHSRAEEALQAADPAGAGPAVMLLDLDGFKAVNDTHGHQVGDRLLQLVARRLQSVVRDDDTVARLGGDEFAVLVHRECTGQELDVLARRLRAHVRAPFAVDDLTLRIDVSIGIAVHPRDGRDVQELLHSADLAMFDAKRRRRGPERYRGGLQAPSPALSQG